MMISQIAWAVPPEGKGNTRPAMLAAELVKLGIVDEVFHSLFHGRSSSTTRAKNAGKWYPGKHLDRCGESAILSPVFYSARSPFVTWMDFYDDWSLAPDINAWHKVLASMTYHAVASGHQEARQITCNSPYMAAKLGLPRTAIVPNGVNPEVASMVTSGNDARRLIMLGHFFDGRTDFELIKRVCSERYFDHIVIGAPGTDPKMLALIERLKQNSGTTLEVYEWLSAGDLANFVGPRTVALVPHVVNDYTLSQDLMKVYMLSALGLRIICPRLLWPSSLSNQFAYLVDYGVRIEDTLSEWIDVPGPETSWRQSVVDDHSWAVRARQIADLMEAR